MIWDVKREIKVHIDVCVSMFMRRGGFAPMAFTEKI